MSETNTRQPVKIFIFKQTLVEHVVEVASKIGDVTLVHGKDAKVGRGFENVKLLALPITFFGVRTFIHFFFPKNQTHIPYYLNGLGGLLKKEEPDVVVTGEIFQPYTWQCLHHARHRSCRIFILSETKAWPRSRISRLLMRLSLWHIKRNLTHVEKIIVWTEQGRQWYEKHLPEVGVVVIPAAVDTEVFLPAKDRVWLPNDILRILMNARFLAFKRHKDLLLAVGQLLKMGKKVNISLIGGSGLGVEDVQEIITELSLADVVTILPPRPHTDMPKLYHEHDILVLPSYNEAIGMVVPEAMACGLPTVTSDTVGANVYVKNNETGFIFETDNVSDLVSKLEKCFDKESLLKMGNRARHESLKYSQSVIGDSWQSLLKR